jgi:GNAT superfamily N-acetyltransferase
VIVDKYRPEDRDEVDALFRRVFGAAPADASALRWDWQYRHNPNAREPQIWIARDEGRIVGQYATMPVLLRVNGRDIDASWGMDVMVAPERQRQGLGEVLFHTWDQNTGASLGMGLSVGSHKLFRKLKWPDVGPVPCLVKPISPRAFRKAGWPAPVNALLSLMARPLLALSRSRSTTRAGVRTIRSFDERFTALWERVAPKFTLAVRRDAAYLQWKYISLPHIRYEAVALDRGEDVAGYAVFRHIDEPRGRVTALVDILADPDDRPALTALLSAVDDHARAAGSDKIRAFVMNEPYRNTMRAQGYFAVRSTIELVAKVNAIPVGPDFYTHTGGWHVTFGDSDQDR